MSHQARYKLLTARFKLVTTTKNKQCEHNLSTAWGQNGFVTTCLQSTCNNMCVFMYCNMVFGEKFHYIVLRIKVQQMAVNSKSCKTTVSEQK
jgi:hypothetical protein